MADNDFEPTIGSVVKIKNDLNQLLNIHRLFQINDNTGIEYFLAKLL